MYKITLYSNSPFSIKVYLAFIFKVLKAFNVNYSFLFLPTKKKRITLLKSPHVNKKAKEQFQIKFFKCIVYIKSNVDFGLFKFLLTNKPKSLSLKCERSER